MEEKLLVEQVCEGDMDAFTVLTARYSNAVYAVAYSVIGDFHLAQDIAQESFIRAWYKIHTLQSGEKFGSWLHAITKRISIDWLRKKDASLMHPGLEQIVDPITIDDKVDMLEIKRQVWNALNVLDEKYREVAVLYFISGFNLKEISKFLNISVSCRKSSQTIKRQTKTGVDFIGRRNVNATQTG